MPFLLSLSLLSGATVQQLTQDELVCPSLDRCLKSCFDETDAAAAAAAAAAAGVGAVTGPGTKTGSGVKMALAVSGRHT